MFEYCFYHEMSKVGENGKHFLDTKDLDRNLTSYGQQGWILRSHTFTVKPSGLMIATFVFGRKIETVAQ